ncbi:FMN-binding protein [Teredinibacter sp. KSP-S5-2]|uniref:FMN-binding protein n=1 Tax=Teredinibacter sp. KSP-S5-2 TaxID=3034506 RepID=UPI002935327A|nr:FMN-binding protein [Teredinibacter sp. KSP-S5-2]WNO10175.1 FMN-binding protein [Teredinibacter sp. KSP-S5-2]
MSSHFSIADEDPLLEFRQKAFAEQMPIRKSIWITKALKEQVREQLDYSFSQLRVRYWVHQNKTAWVLEEIGKEQPITFGVVVNDGHIEFLEVLQYRESRGGEIQYDFFARQFEHAQLVQDKSPWKLSQKIDGITGATLSVRASKKIAKLALFLHIQVIQSANEKAH